VINYYHNIVTIIRRIEQLQFTGAESFSNAAVKSKLALNHPCKELVWVVQPDSNVAAKGLADYTYDDGSHTIVDAKLQLNGHDRFSTRGAAYFNLVNYANKSIELMAY
jgi:hypothetical protein